MSDRTEQAIDPVPSWHERLGLVAVVAAALVVGGLYLGVYAVVTTPADDAVVPGMVAAFSLLPGARFLRFVAGLAFVAVLAYQTRPPPLRRDIDYAIVASLAAAILTWHIRTEAPDEMTGGLFVVCIVTAVLAARIAWPAAVVLTPIAALCFTMAPEENPHPFIVAAGDRTDVLYGLAAGAVATLAGGVRWWIARRAQAGAPAANARVGVTSP